MDRFNVITPTSNLDDLNNDMAAWASLSYDRRMRADEECIRRYNMTNIDFYNRIKAAIINNEIPEDSELIGNAISEGAIIANDKNLVPELSFLNDDDQDFIWKKQMAAQLEISPNVVIISPFRGENKEYTLDELEAKYLKYAMLTARNRLFSNSYSTNIWGYDVPNMYVIMRKKIMSLDGLDGDIIATLGESKFDKSMIPKLDLLTEKMVQSDPIELLKIKLDSCADIKNWYHRSVYESMNENINRTIYERDFSETIPKVVPFFTVDEMAEFGLENNLASSINPADYYKTISEKMNLLESASGEQKDLLTEEIISLGWNPSVPITEQNLAFARRRQCKWLKEHACRIIDIQGLQSKTAILESSATMRNLYKRENLYPVYIVLSFTNTMFGKVIRAIKHSNYTHAGICLDSNLSQIMTFKFGAEWNGFSTESIDFYLTVTKDASVDVLCLFVDKNTKIKMEAVFKDFIEKQDKTKYGFGNLFNILFNKAKDGDPENLSLVCSQFVDTVLKLCNINITKKPSNLVIPQDFSELSSNPKVYRVFEGYARDYNEKKVEDSLFALLQMTDKSELRYQDAIDMVNESFIEAFYSITENAHANEVLSEMRDILKPEAAIVEGKFPISFTDKGDVVIKLYKSLEQEYQEAHRLLKQYGENNLEGVKHELARLFYVNSAIEKKVKKMQKDDDNYKKFIDLRARVLNDFKKYFKIVIEKEPDFNFSEYFQKSEYYNGNIIIDNSVLKFTGNLIKKFLKSLGI